LKSMLWVRFFTMGFSLREPDSPGQLLSADLSISKDAIQTEIT
jgi:hypothetical protein